MAVNQAIVDALVQRLKLSFSDLAVEDFPDKPDEYRLNHPKGAVLVSYLGTKYEAPVDADLVVQDATARFSATVVLRQLNGPNGAVAILGRMRKALQGFKPPGCQRKVWLLADRFLGESAGIWHYALDFATQTVAVEDADTDAGPLLNHLTAIDSFSRHEVQKLPDGSIIREEFPL